MRAEAFPRKNKMNVGSKNVKDSIIPALDTIIEE